MRLNSDQELRRELLLFSLSKQLDLEAAIRMAAQMERFVLLGLDKGAEPASDADVADDSGKSQEPAVHPAPGASGEGVSPAGVAGPPDSAGAAEGAGAAGTRVTKRRWSAEDDELLRQRWRSEGSLEAIAEELDRTVASLYSRARALGMPKRNALAAEVFFEAVAPAAASASRASSCQRRQAADTEPARVRQVSLNIERHLPPRHGDRKMPGARKTLAGKAGGSRCGRSVPDEPRETGVDPIIHFLRSRDYSVVRVGEGRFRLDGRRVLSADELREKANQVRKTLGLPLFGAPSAGPVVPL